MHVDGIMEETHGISRGCLEKVLADELIGLRFRVEQDVRDLEPADSRRSCHHLSAIRRGGPKAKLTEREDEVWVFYIAQFSLGTMDGGQIPSQ